MKNNKSVYMDSYLLKILLTVIIIVFTEVNVLSQNNNIIKGKVVDKNNMPLVGVNIYLNSTNYGGVSDLLGKFKIANIPDGNYILTAKYIGYKSYTKRININNNNILKLKIILLKKPVRLNGIVVTATRSADLTFSMANLTHNFVQKDPAKTVGDLLRELPGINAVRRGPIGLDPVIRGLRETEVGTYVDGTRYFPGGAARMDSPLSHYDPTSVDKVQVVKGPYALTWGAGNLSAIKVTSPSLPGMNSKILNGKIITGYQSNFNAKLASASINGRKGLFSYWINGDWREGKNYTDGNGVEIPAGFHSKEIRGKLGIDLNSLSTVILSGGYQKQNDLDYPGRLLNARFFKVANFNVKYLYHPENGILKNLEIVGYVNNVDHRMDNNGKPTSLPMPGRKPPFPLFIGVNTSSNVKGGKISAKLKTGNFWHLNIGGDYYYVNRNAVRNISRRDNGKILFDNDIIWPDVNISDAGIYVKTERMFNSNFKLTGTIRLDVVNVNSGKRSLFFLENVSKQSSAKETNFSGSFLAEKYLTKHLTISMGIGSVVRTADANERFSDRFPASKSQTSAEFVGNPALKPERSNQLDFWIESFYPDFSLKVNFFGRRVTNFITITPTNLKKKLPLSPNTVFQYINGNANFWGFESSVFYKISNILNWYSSAAYLWGKDYSQNEPALGITPFTVNTSLNFHNKEKTVYVEGLVNIVADQNRFARAKGETRTGGYTIFDLRAGVNIFDNLQLNFGVLNLTDKNYVNHLNAKNPFTKQQVPEPGRVFYMSVGFVY